METKQSNNSLDRINSITFQSFNLSIFQFFLLLFFTSSLFSQNIDNLNYNYNQNTNQLNRITDAVSPSTSAVDIDNENVNNYGYNYNGQLIKDDATGISNIEWTPSAKVKKVTKNDGSTIEFMYDAMGNRIEKIYTDKHAAITKTFYITDANGILLSTYEKTATSSTISQSNVNLQGGNQLGVMARNIDQSTTPTNDSTYTRSLGNKQYELKDHLGNVRTVISDIKNSTITAFVPGSYTADISATNDFYAYGMVMPGRDNKSNTYEYGIQGKLKENGMMGQNNAYDFGARIYDPRVGRWLSVDPLAQKYPSVSPYNYCENNPIIFEDYGGMWTFSGVLHAAADKLDAARTYMHDNRHIALPGPMLVEALAEDALEMGAKLLRTGDETGVAVTSGQHPVVIGLTAIKEGADGFVTIGSLVPTTASLERTAVVRVEGKLAARAEIAVEGGLVAARAEKIAAKGVAKTPTKAVTSSESAKTTAVIGKYNNPDGTPGTRALIEAPDASMGPNPGGIDVFSMPEQVWEDVGAQRFWSEYNKPWLDNAIDGVYDGTYRLKTVSEPSGSNLFRSDGTLNGGFADEFFHTAERGLDYDPISGEFLLPEIE